MKTKLLIVLSLFISSQTFASTKIEKTNSNIKTTVGEISSSKIDSESSTSLNMKDNSFTAELDEEVSKVMMSDNTEQTEDSLAVDAY